MNVAVAVEPLDVPTTFSGSVFGWALSTVPIPIWKPPALYPRL